MVAVLADECAFWLSEESVNPDVEILNAARPALATTQGPLIAISSPYARRGALWDTENGTTALRGILHPCGQGRHQGFQS